jgi:hypothetical protein
LTTRSQSLVRNDVCSAPIFRSKKLWTSYRDLVEAYRTAAARLRPEQRDAILQPPPSAFTGWDHEHDTPQGATIKKAMNREE